MSNKYNSLYETHLEVLDKLQYVIDWMDKNGLLAEHVFTFPDGDSWHASTQSNTTYEN